MGPLQNRRLLEKVLWDVNILEELQRYFSQYYMSSQRTYYRTKFFEIYVASTPSERGFMSSTSFKQNLIDLSRDSMTYKFVIVPKV